MKPSEVDSALFTKAKIHTVGIVWENISGVRITPNVYTSLKDLDRLVNTHRQYCRRNKKKSKKLTLSIRPILYLPQKTAVYQ